MSTKIEWTDETWNPATGCTKVSAGCDNCYIERTRPFRTAHRSFVSGLGSAPTTGVLMHADRLDKPLHWRKPRRVFVNSLSDLFHESIPNAYIARVFGVMAAAPQHTFQVLTKRPGRMASLLNSPHFRETWFWERNDAFVRLKRDGDEVLFPSPNVWLGVSVENQQWANVRIPHLLRTPAAVRFLSCEPLLGPVDLLQYLRPRIMNVPVSRAIRDDGGVMMDGFLVRPDHPGIDWVIAGGESGPGARAMHPEWARSLREQCVGAHVPFFFKQWGEWRFCIECEDFAVEQTMKKSGELKRWNALVGTDREISLSRDGTVNESEHYIEGVKIMQRVGKRAAGRELDGRTWDEFPAAVPA